MAPFLQNIQKIENQQHRDWNCQPVSGGRTGLTIVAPKVAYSHLAFA